MFAGLRKRKGLCWICLEESTLNRSWTRHECGCKLDIHKDCYFKWLFDLNKSSQQGKWAPDCGFEPFQDELKRKICNAIDCHRDFQKTIPPTEMIGSLPLFWEFWAGTADMSVILIGNILGFDSFVRYPYVQAELPIEIAPCPQCKKPIVAKPVKFTSTSWVLSLAYRLKKIISGATMLTVLAFSTLNIGKWTFKLGLWQLRCLFPEKVLRTLLDVSTTKALDVYGETMHGRMSVPNVTQFLVFGFPLYLIALRGSFPALKKLQWIYSLVFTVRAGHYAGKSPNIVSNIVSAANLLVLFHSTIVSPTLTRLYELMVKSVRPYFCVTSDYRDIFPSDEYANVIVETSWSDVIFESTLWPLVGGLLGGKLFDAFVWLQDKLSYQCTPSGSPNEVRMVFNVLGCGILSVARQTFNLYLTYLRIQELKQIQETFEECPQ